MCNDCSSIPLKNRETEVTQWDDRGQATIIDHYTEYNCKSCGRRCIMRFEDE